MTKTKGLFTKKEMAQFGKVMFDMGMEEGKAEALK